MIMVYFEYIFELQSMQNILTQMKKSTKVRKKRETAGEAGYKTVRMEFSDLPNNSLFPKISVLK